MSNMKKMKYVLYDRIFKDETLSRLELKTLFWLAAHQDPGGCVAGVFYKDIIKDLNCSKSGFYLVRDTLVKKNYIEIDKTDSSDMDLTLIGNSFVKDSGEIKYEGYVDLEIDMFNDPEFFDLKAGAIKLAMYYTKRVSAAGAVTATNNPYNSSEAEKKRKLWYNPIELCKTLKGILKVNIRSIKEYMKLIERWIGKTTVQNEGKRYRVVTVLAKSLKKTKKKGYAEQEAYKQKVKMFCRRNNKEYDERNLTDTADLIRQYKNIASKYNLNIITMICKAIDNTCCSILNSYNVHKTLRNLINYNEPGLLK